MVTKRQAAQNFQAGSEPYKMPTEDHGLWPGTPFLPRECQLLWNLSRAGGIPRPFKRQAAALDEAQQEAWS
jgi:hypothetical protein